MVLADQHGGGSERRVRSAKQKGFGSGVRVRRPPRTKPLVLDERAADPPGQRVPRHFKRIEARERAPDLDASVAVDAAETGGVAPTSHADVLDHLLLVRDLRALARSMTAQRSAGRRALAHTSSLVTFESSRL